MAHTTRSRRTTAVLAALTLGVMALTACKGSAEEDTAAPSATASPSAADTHEGTDTPSTADPSDGGSDSGDSTARPGSTPPSSEPGSDDGQDGGVGMCETTDLSYNVTVASKPVNHALLTATNQSADPCLLPADELVITIPGLDGAAEHMGPDGEDWLLGAGERAYAGIMFSRADTAGGKSADKVEVALTASESPTTVPIDDGPVTVNDGQVTSFFGTAEDALTY
ncbi:DUF4232 domain-containing protein [Streptomyces sp. DSM 40750]|uniref:DUF4232 domain-containing protein n=1 Tax=Streptomyces sp. DSM 40750 TaxID=2801030 RepID=UPI00214C248F|nr:DUF4232 domain-containing protein [Streptomyces sp. DSM 40750]UUU19311.1 DUF4232 domain-containing protein [Streptomyces sp. DSM 40750]UUU27346.1 DUF4232 domain-containing protein [Streptomyces sp. DSM 40750]